MKSEPGFLTGFGGCGIIGKMELKGGLLVAFDKLEYNAQYTKTHYERITLTIPKGTKAVVKQMAGDYGVSMTQLALSAIEQKYGVSLTESKTDFNG
jgi:hypothetical protein